MNGRPDHYVLNPDHSLRPVELMEWARAFESMDRRVAFTQVAPGIEVSTVFLGLDHNWSPKGPPLVFETMVFDDYGGNDQWRYATWDEAIAGHAKTVAELRAKFDCLEIREQTIADPDSAASPPQSRGRRARDPKERD